MAPSRYQFTETMVEVRADLQMGSMSEFNVGVNAGVKGAVFAVAVNASYARRSAYDARAAALIRTVLNAIPAEPGMLDKLLPRAGEVLHATEPKSERYKELAEAFKEVVSLAPPPLPQEPAKPGETKKTEEAKTTEEKPGETAAPAGETAQTTGETVGETPKADEPAPPDEQADKGAAPVEKSPSATEP
jgi:hypothetical protein